MHEKADQFSYEWSVLGEDIQSKEQYKYDKNDGQHSWNPNEFTRFHFPLLFYKAYL
jgi:hypothetical protein